MVLFALLWRTTPPLQTEASVNGKGQDVLRVQCASCPDGTRIRAGDTEQVVQDRRAEIPLSKPLGVGRNELELSIDRPGSGRDETVSVVIPVSYRIRPQLSSLALSRPAITIEVQAQPGASVTIDGASVGIGADGTGRTSIDVSNECTGATLEVRTLDRTITYAVRSPDGRAQAGSLIVRSGITPLLLHAPRPHLVVDTDSFTVAGRTAKGATVSIEDATFQPDPDGSFVRRLRVNRLGTTDVTVRATAPGHATRLVRFSVTRVSDLKTHAAEFEASATLQLDSVLEAADDHLGKAIVLQGQVLEPPVGTFERIVAFDAVKQCSRPPCFVRLFDSGTVPLKKGDRLRVFGHFAGVHQSPGARPIPEVDVDFLLVQGKAKR